MDTATRRPLNGSGIIPPHHHKHNEHVFMINRERAIDYLNTRPRLYVVDGFAGSTSEITLGIWPHPAAFKSSTATGVFPVSTS